MGFFLRCGRLDGDDERGLAMPEGKVWTGIGETKVERVEN